MSNQPLCGGYLTASLSRNVEIVVSGMSGQFPNSRNVDDFLKKLLKKTHLCDEDDRRWVISHSEIPKLGGKIYDVEKFDAGYFGIHKYHSFYIDPVGRIFLEQAVQALFDAGIHPDEWKGTNTGVFVGACASEYELLLYRKCGRNSNLLPGTTRSMIAHRVSYCLQLNGPSVICDTACSSGMYALELAYRSILEGRCDRAIVGGTNLTLDPYMTLQFARLGVLNYGTGCRPFDDTATGYTRSEAIVAIILQKKVESKRIYAKVVHAKTNADGFKSSGITFPSFDGQLMVLQEVYDEAHVDRKEIGFLEAHGTGTRVGDPEEGSVIDAYFAPTLQAPLLIGSIKGNIGHTEPSSGLCSLVKVLCAMNFGQIPPNIHFEKPRTGLKALHEKRMKVVTEVTPFPSDKKFAGINCFGFGGANGHVIVEKCSKLKTNQSGQFTPPRLVCYSGRTQEAVLQIHECVSTCTDLEYLGLIHEVFKRPFTNHLYRGFTLVGGNLHSNKAITQCSQERIILILNHYQNLVHFDDFMQIPLLRNIIDEVKTHGFMEDNPNVIMQLVLLKVFVGLSLDISLLVQDELSNGIDRYQRNLISFQELAKLFHAKNNNSNANVQQLLKLFTKKTTKYGKKATIVLVGGNSTFLQNSFTNKINLIHFGDQMTTEDLLYNIGRLYEEGHNPQVDKLYQKVEFPVSCGTDMLSHLVKWKHDDLPLLNWGKSSFTNPERIESIKMITNEFLFYRGHMIDDRNLFPATGYLWVIWTMFGDLGDHHPNDLSVVFENVRFHRACTINQEGIDMYLVIHSNGNFEVSENDATIVTGRIMIYDEDTDGTAEFTNEDTEYGTATKEAYVLTGKEAYKELRLRGYNYRGLFRAIQELSPNKGIIKWESNWVTFLDNMMQVCILQEDNRNLYVPVGVDRLVIRAKDHLKWIDAKEEKLVPVYFDKIGNTIRSKFVEMRGLNARSITRRKERLHPVLESYQFVPNEYTTNLATSIRINMQILLECKQTMNFKVVELIGPAEEGDQENEEYFSVSREICNVLEDMPLVLPNMTIVTCRENVEVANVKVEAEMTEQNLLFVCKNPTDEILQQADEALLEDGFLLCVSTSDCVFPDNFISLTKHTIEDGRVVYMLQKRVSKDTKPVTIDVSNIQDVSWLKQVQDAMQKNNEVILLSQNNSKSGILGFINCLNKEPGGDKVRCVFVQDWTAKFDSNQLDTDADIKKQLAKRLPINVLNNGVWGTYRHLLLPNLEQISTDHWYAKTLTPGDLTTLKWLQGPLHHSNVNSNIKIMYSALNFRDLMLASGKLSVEAVTRDRFLQERVTGFEFAGYDHNGIRICGMGTGAIANMMDTAYFTCEVPDEWALEDAATIVVVYCTVTWAMQKIGNLKTGDCVLIHSGTGGVGLAALNLCTYFECEIFVTVGTQEKRDFLMETYPNIKPSHIGNSRDTSFKEMIMRETNGRGVDIVLNSLAEEKLEASIDCLAFGGTFLEIGKYDLDKNNELRMDLARKECSYHGIMLDSLMLDAKDTFKNDLRELLMTGIRKGYVKPLPKKIFQIDELEKAFKFMGTGKHIGKLLIQIDHDRIDHKVLPRMYCNPNCSYIVFGGLGGFGLELVDWLITRGAKHIVLSSRKGVTTGYQRYRIEIWKSYGVNITIAMEDVTNYDTCHKLLDQTNLAAPIDGIFNVAVVLSDAIFEHQTIETMKTSMLPKPILTDHLDHITRKLCPNMSYFVVFSSVSCGRGNAGQTNYGFSNSIMERICELRQQDGLPALAVQWGAVGDVGLLEELQKENNEIAIGGTLQQKVGNCLKVFDQLIQQKQPVVSSIVVAEKFSRGAADTPIEAVLRILSLSDIKSVSPHSALPELGMDSMMAVEIRQILEREFDILLSPNDLRNLTFAKLEEMSAGYGKEISGLASDDVGVLTMLLPGVMLAESKEAIVDFNVQAATCQGDFIVVFPGIDADIRSFQQIAGTINKHMKCVSYDSITRNQEVVDVIVDHVFNALHEDIKQKKSFKIMAHSVGSLAAIEFVKRIESLGITGTLMLFDGAPDLMYRIIDIIKGTSEVEFECNVIEAIVSIVLPTESNLGFKEILRTGQDFAERAELLLNYFTTPTIEVKSQLKSLTISLMSRVRSVHMYKTRPNLNEMIHSKVILYKPTITILNDIVEDYNLKMVCHNLYRIDTFEGNHITLLQNDKMHQQLLIDMEL